MVALDVERDDGRGADSRLDVHEHLLKWRQVCDVAGGVVAARPDQVYDIDAHDAEQLRPYYDAEGNRGVEGDSKEDRRDGVEDVTAGHTSVVGHDHHVVFVDDGDGLCFPGGRDFCQAVESVVRPEALYLLPILISEDAHAVLDIVAPLSFELDSIAGDENAVPVPHILRPIATIVAIVGPLARSNVFSHPVAVDFSLIVAIVDVDDSHSSCGRLLVRVPIEGTVRISAFEHHGLGVELQVLQESLFDVVRLEGHRLKRQLKLRLVRIKRGHIRSDRGHALRRPLHIGHAHIRIIWCLLAHHLVLLPRMYAVSDATNKQRLVLCVILLLHEWVT